MSVNRQVESAFRSYNVVNQPVVLGVSGGPDSQALLKCIGHLQHRLGLQPTAVGINHGLRSEADEELNLAEKLAQSVGIPFVRRSVRLDGGGSLQAAARDARYGALFDIADSVGAKFVVTAHHWDDRAETVLFRLLRGRGLGSLGVMPPISGRVFRPMLGVRHDDLLAYCRRWQLQYANDPSNDDDKYSRVLIRRKLLPLLEEVSPQLRSRLNELSDDVLRLTSTT